MSGRGYGLILLFAAVCTGADNGTVCLAAGGRFGCPCRPAMAGCCNRLILLFSASGAGSHLFAGSFAAGGRFGCPCRPGVRMLRNRACCRERVTVRLCIGFGRTACRSDDRHLDAGRAAAVAFAVLIVNRLVAIPECIRADRRNGIRNRHRGQAGEIERIRADGGNRCAQLDRSEIRCIERTVRNRCHGIGNRDRGQPDAVGECGFADACHARRNADFSERSAPVECGSRNCRNG